MTCVDSVPVLLNNVLTLLAVGSFCGSLHVAESVLERNDVGKLEECGLENSIDTSSHACFFAKLNAVDSIEIDIVLSNISLHLTGEISLKTFHIPDSVEEESSAGLDIGNHIVLVDIALVMAGYEVSLINKVCRLDGSLAETEVGDRYAARLL